MYRSYITIILFGWGSAFAGNYATCLLDKMPGSPNEAFTTAVVGACLKDNPESFYEIKKGDGKGIFGFATPEVCTMKKSATTTNSRGSFLIARACQCLYGDPEYKDQLCVNPFDRYK